MAFARHTNTDVRNDLIMGKTVLPLILGQFEEKDIGNPFEYSERRWHTDEFAPEFPHVIYVSGRGKWAESCETRLAKVLKTVAYIVVNEDENGEPIVEKWYIKNHKEYDTSWVRASN